MNVKKGFTLAEVLITLSIIGVVAALTIPSLTKKFEKQQWITGYKTTFSILSQATNMIKANNDGSLDGAWDMSGDIHSAAMYNAFLPYLKTALKVENENMVGKCISAKTTYLNNESYESDTQTGYCVVLTNGTSLVFYSYNNIPSVMSFINIDLNGIKGPNVSGKDIHSIYVYKQSEDPEFRVNAPDPDPSGWFESAILEGCPDNLKATIGQAGYSCGVRILRGDYGKDY